MILPHIYDVDISQPLLPTVLQPMMVTGDKLANRIGVRLKNGAQPYTPDGSCRGYVLRADGATVPILNGVVNGNEMYIDLPEAAYAVQGSVVISIVCVTSTAITTVFLGSGTVNRSQTDVVIDPGTVIDDISTLIQAIETAVASIPQDYSTLSANMNALTHVGLSITGNYIAPGGAQTANAEYNCSDFIPVNADSVLILRGFFTGTSSGSALAYAFYNASKAFISGQNGISTDTTVTTIPSGAAYVRFSSRVSQGETPVAYVSNHVVETLANLAPRMDDAEADVADLKSAFDATVDMMTDEYVVDYSQITAIRYVINSSGNWNATSGSNLGSSSTIEIPNGANKIILKANSSSGTFWALLKTYDPSALTGAADFCTQYVGRQTLTEDVEIEIDIPNDAKFLYVHRSTSGGSDCTPYKVSFKSAVVTKNEFIPRGNIVPNYTREYDNTYYYANSAGVSLSSGSSNSYATLVIPVEPSTHYVCNKLRYVTFIGADGKSEAASLEAVTEFTTLSTTKRIYAVFFKSDNTKDNLIISSGYSLDSETGEYEIPWLYDPNKKTLDNLKNRTFGIVKPFLQYKGNEQSYMFENPNSIKRDKVGCFSCDFSLFGSLEVGLAGPTGGNSISIIIDATNVTIKKFGTSGTGTPHGLTISNRISVVLTQTVDGEFIYEISSNGAKYTGETAYSNGYTRFYFEASDMTATNVDFVSTCKDIYRDIWMFGDSYFSYGENRWVYYLITNENSGRCLIDAYAGEGSDSALPSLKSYINLAKPKYILWCVGMNDGSDSNSAPNATWMSAVNDVLSICNENDITPVFGTIPTVPSVNHEQKNAWIRNSGYQYIDFAKAVGAQSDGTWFAWMLSNDNVHPTASGAMALYYQAITDFPQFLQNK